MPLAASKSARRSVTVRPGVVTHREGLWPAGRLAADLIDNTDRPHGSGPFGIDIFTAERAVVVRSAHLLQPGPPDVRLHFSSISCIMML